MSRVLVYRLQLNALLQADGRFAIDDPQNNVINTFLFRRIRPILQGRVANVFEFYFNPDFAGGVVNIRDAYVDTMFSPAFRIRVGKGKEPFGLERLQSASYLTFVERVIVRPFVRKTKSPLAGLGLALAGSSGKQPTELPSFLTSGRQTFFSYDHAAVGEGVRTRISPQGSYSFKSVWTFGEYVRSVGAVRKNGISNDITHASWVLAGSVVLTGEAAGDRGVKPRKVFDPGKHTWGNWYLNPYIKWVVNIERTVFDGDPNGARHAENVILIRNQISF